MAESITFNNATYIIPDVGESNWGQNLTNYFVAIPQGAYQLSGGTAPLTADLSFGTNFGIFAKYLTSVGSNPASSGVVRLANNGDGIKWRNAANNADISLFVDASNELQFNGVVIATPSGGNVLAITGTANQVIASAATGNVTLSLPQSIATTSTPTFTAVISATTHPASAGVIRLANTEQLSWRNAANSADLSFGLNSSNNFVSGASIQISPTTNQIVLGSTNVVTISSVAPASSRTYTILDAGGAANFLLSGWGQIVNADISASAAIAFSKLASLTSAHLLVGSAGNVATDVALSGDATLANTGAITLATVNGNVGSFTNASLTVNAKGLITAAASGTAPVTSVSGTANQITSTGGATPVLALASPLTTPGSVTVTGNITFTPTTNGIVGTTTNNSATAGNVGEVISASVTSGSPVSLASTTPKTVTSIALTAGDWDVHGVVGYIFTAASCTSALQSNSLANNTNGGEDSLTAMQFTMVSDCRYLTPVTRISIASPTTIYLVASLTFTGTIAAFGTIYGRRMR